MLWCVGKVSEQVQVPQRDDACARPVLLCCCTAIRLVHWKHTEHGLVVANMYMLMLIVRLAAAAARWRAYLLVDVNGCWPASVTAVRALL
jgi:hypothetical protein